MLRQRIEEKVQSIRMESVKSPWMMLFFFPLITFAHIGYQQLELPPGVIGPESFAFYCNGDGPYTGVSDGRIIKWEGSLRRWSEFAVTAPFRKREVCDGSSDSNLEPICGRPLGIKFNKLTCELYIADAYFGLMKVGKDGGKAVQLVSSAEGVPFNFTNSLDIHLETGTVYFTDTSSSYQLRESMKVMESGDDTGRFMKYDKDSKQVTVLLRGIHFANGVALSNDNSYVLVAETSKNRVIRYWLQGNKATTSEVFIDVPGPPDNVKMNNKGEFWVGLNYATSSPSPKDFETIAVRIDAGGGVLEKLHGNGLMLSVSDVQEIKGSLLVGSLATPYVSIVFPSYRNSSNV